MSFFSYTLHFSQFYRVIIICVLIFGHQNLSCNSEYVLSVYTDVPTPLNLSNITNKASTATVTSEQVSTLSTNNAQIPIMSGTNEQHVTSGKTGDNIDVSQMVFEGTTNVDMNSVPVYSQPVVLATKQILLLHPHLSEEEDDSSESLSTQTESEALSSDHEDIIPSESVTSKVTKAPPDILDKECQIKIDQLTDDEISMWAKAETLPEFPAFVKGRGVGGYTMRIKTAPSKPRHNTQPSRCHSTQSYKDLDTELEVTSPKKPKHRHRPVPKDGPSAEWLAAHRFYPCSRTKTEIETDDRTTTDLPETEEKSASQEPPRPAPTQKVLTEPVPKGKLIVTTHGVTAHTTRKRRFKCPDCDVVESTYKLLNVHFKATHNKLFCEECRQMFSTPSALDRHMYIHNKEEQLKCSCCDETFPFPSDLKIHMVKHLKVLGFQCGHGDCQKWFNHKGERDKHARTHTAADLNCD